MTHYIKKLNDYYVVDLKFPSRPSAPCIQLILDSVFELGGQELRLAKSYDPTSTFWTFSRELWFNNAGTIDYIRHRVPFDQVYCETLEQAALIAERMEQWTIVSILKQ